MSLIKKIKYKISKRYFKFKRKLNPPHIPSQKEENVIFIVTSLIKDETSVMMIAPISDKKYIKNETRGMFVVIDDVNITLSSNVGMYYYNIQVDTSVSKKICRNFNNVLESRRNKMEKETVAGITNNLDFIAKHMDYFIEK